MAKANLKTNELPVNNESHAFTYNRYVTLNLPVPMHAIESMSLEMGISKDGLIYCLQYGITQTLNDEIAGVKSGIVGTDKKAPTWTEKECQELAIKLGLANDVSRDVLAETYSRKLQKDQWANIVNGTLGPIGERGPRLSLEERTRRDVIALFHADAVAKFNAKLPDGKKVTLPKGKDLTAQQNAWYNANAKNKTRVDNEVTRRMALTTMTEDDEDEFLKTLMQ